MENQKPNIIFFSPTQDLNRSPLKPKACVPPMGYTDPFSFQQLTSINWLNTSGQDKCSNGQDK